MRLRNAKPEDLELLKYWDTKQHVQDSTTPDDIWDWEYELGRHPEWREMLIAEHNGEAIGYIHLIDPYLEETKYWGEVEQNRRALDIWIGEEENLGRGYGTQMMKLAIERCFRDPSVVSILIDPLKTNVRAHRFYERLGFQFVEEREFENTPCYVYELVRSQRFGSTNL